MKPYFLPLLLLYSAILGGQFPPGVGQLGSRAIFKDSSIIRGWAKEAIVTRGWTNIASKDKKAAYGIPENALGRADGVVVSLGDSGMAVLMFDPPIVDGPGPDLAVFENGFDNSFLELAHVEVSSDGIHYYRFPSISLTDTSAQIGTFESLDPTKLYNLAGKYRVLYGTPFDLSEMEPQEYLDKNSIRYVRIIDVVGAIHGKGVTRDSRGYPINDPYPTPFVTGGFDLDAVGALNILTGLRKIGNIKAELKLWPNPVKNIPRIHFKAPVTGAFTMLIYDIEGRCILKKIFKSSVNDSKEMDVSTFVPGVYIVSITEEISGRKFSNRLVVE